MLGDAPRGPLANLVLKFRTASPRESQVMADEEESKSGENERNDDLVSYLYVLGGIPTLIAFFLILFLLVGSCDQANVMIPA